MMANKCNKIFQEFKFSLSDVYLHQDVVFFTLSFTLFESLCAILCHLYKFENMQNTHGGVILLVKLQVEACDFTKSNTPSWLFFTFFKLYKWYQHCTKNQVFL